MANITGANTRVGLGRSTTWGTAGAAGANQKYEGQVSWDESREFIIDNPIGSGADMVNAATSGATSPKATLTGNTRFEGQGWPQIADFFGADSITANAIGTACASHSLLYDAALAIRTKSYSTLAFDSTAGSTIEIATMMPTRVAFTFENFPNLLNHQIDLVGHSVSYTSSTNTSATMASATAQTTVRTIPDVDDAWRMNAFSGAALASGDVRNITKVEIVYEYPLEFVREMKNSAGNGVPRASGNPEVFTATVNVTYRSQADYQVAMAAAQQSDSTFKADLTVTGPTISGAANYFVKFFFPCLQIMDYQSDLQDSGENDCTISFRALHAPSIPSGMLARYPHIVLQNTQITSMRP